ADPDLHASLVHLSPSPGLDEAPATQQTRCDAASSISERFRVLRPHAKGGLGEVFVALDQDLHREVALKEIQAGWAHDSSSRERFLGEGEFRGRLEHPGVVPVYGLGT